MYLRVCYSESDYAFAGGALGFRFQISPYRVQQEICSTSDIVLTSWRSDLILCGDERNPNYRPNHYFLLRFNDLFATGILARISSHSLRPNKSSRLSLRGLLLSIADLITSDNSIEFWTLSATVRIFPQATHFQFLPTFTSSKWPHLLDRFLLGSRKSTSIRRVGWTRRQSLIRSPS